MTEKNVRSRLELYPSFSAEIDEIDDNGITIYLLQKIIRKHHRNSLYNKRLYERYQCLQEGVPIFSRSVRYQDDDRAINNKVNNDFFSEIVDFKTGFFSGNPIGYSYSNTDESEETTGGEKAVEIATKAVTDFTARNNMFDVDMETTKLASIYGYAGRLFYIDVEGNERVTPIQGYETIILSKTDITEPQYAIRYYENKDIDGNTFWNVEFYDNQNLYFFKCTGNSFSKMELVYKQPHMFDYCPLQGIPNNKELLGDAEKVISAIDDYDKVVSDNSNEIESFVYSLLMFENINITEEEVNKAQHSGALSYYSGANKGRAYYLTKEVNDSFVEHHLERIEKNIYRFSKTPNLSDETFGSASGVSLKFKLHGLEAKCGMFEAKMISAGTYMFKLLASAWRKKKIDVDPLQCVMTFKRNFPTDTLSEAQTVQTLISSGLPKTYAYNVLSDVDDVNYIMELIEQEKDDIPDLDNQSEDERNTNSM